MMPRPNLVRVPDPDALHEARIQEALVRYSHNPSHIAWEAVKKLVAERSPEQVKRMERQKGIT